MTVEEFDRDPVAARRMAEIRPVFVVDGGGVRHVLLSIADYRRLATGRGSLVEALAQEEDEEIEFEPSRANIAVRPVDLS